MVNITAAEVNKLRQQTGAGMMDCKKALVEADGDFEHAIDILRKKGQKLALKRAEKNANEGIVLARTTDDKTFGILFMLNCETDFVAKNQEFIDFAQNIVALALEFKPRSLDVLSTLTINGRTVAEGVSDLIGKTGEKMELSHYEFIETDKVYAYNHQGNRLATLLGFSGSDYAGLDQIGHEITMQIAAMNPIAIDKGDVSKEMIDREIEVGKEQAREEGKPEEMLEKIALGKLNKFYKENTLLNQEFIRDSSLTVGDYLAKADKNLKVVAFKRLMLGA